MATGSRHTTPSPKTPSRRRAGGRRGKRHLRQRVRLQLTLATGGVALLAVVAFSRSASLPGVSVAPRPPVATLAPTGQQAQFIGRVGSTAQRLRTAVGLPPSLVTAMAINETGWGSSETQRTRQQLLRHQGRGGRRHGGPHRLRHTRSDRRPGGADPSAFSCVRLTRRKRSGPRRFFARQLSLRPAVGSREDPRATARALAQAGYATDPDWAPKLIALIDSFGLDSLDVAVWSPPWPAWPLPPETT